MALASEDRVTLSAGSAAAAEARAPNRWLGSYSPPAPPRGAAAVESRAANQRGQARFSSFFVARLAAAFILLLAASLKLHAWLAVDVAASPLGDSLWQLALIVGEFALAAWLLSGRAELGSWVAAVLCFSAFAGVSIAKALAREASCGCFGSLEISPWLAGLIDVAVVTGLCIWRPTVALSGTRLSRHRVGACLLVAAPVVLACAAALGMFVDAPAVLTDDGTIAGNGHTVLVEPDNWVGKRLPLLAYLDIAQQVESGQWRVVFFREGCASCSAAISATFSDGGTEEGQSVAVVRTGGSPAQHRTQWRCLSGQTDTSIEWLMETPLIVDLMDGVVTRITTSRKSPQRGWTSARSPTQSLEGRPGV